MNQNRTFLSFVLALLLLFAQQAAVAHAVVHAVDPDHARQEQQLPGEQHCDQCHACAELGSAMPSTFVLPLPQAEDWLPSTEFVPQAELPQRPTLFDSRAPPSA